MLTPAQMDDAFMQTVDGHWDGPLIDAFTNNLKQAKEFKDFLLCSIQQEKINAIIGALYQGYLMGRMESSATSGDYQGPKGNVEAAHA
jgi:hypothetical protein